jgi:hypothetical protein
MSAKKPKGPQPLSLGELLLMVRNGGLAEDARAWAAKWHALGEHIAEHYRGALDRLDLDATRGEFRPEMLGMLRLSASGATVGKIAKALAEWEHPEPTADGKRPAYKATYTANGVRAALAGLDGELRAAAKLPPVKAVRSNKIEWSDEMLPKEIAAALGISRTLFYERRYITKQYRWRRVGNHQKIQIALNDVPPDRRGKLRSLP